MRAAYNTVRNVMNGSDALVLVQEDATKMHIYKRLGSSLAIVRLKPLLVQTRELCGCVVRGICRRVA